MYSLKIPKPGESPQEYFSNVPAVPYNSNERILIYHTFKMGDLINFTNHLRVWRKYYPDIIIDFLTYKSYTQILETNKDIDNLLFIEDFPQLSLVKYVHKLDNQSVINAAPDIDEVMQRLFTDYFDYDKIINFWPVYYRNILFSLFSYERVAENWIEISLQVPKLFGFNFPMETKDNMPLLYFSKQDIEIVKKVGEAYKDKKIVLFEHLSGSWPTRLTNLSGDIIWNLQDRGFLVAGNHVKCDINLQNLNLRQIKLFFQKYCFMFIGCNSGITSSVYSLPTNYKDKYMIIDALCTNWNYYQYFKQKPKDYLFLVDQDEQYSLDQICKFCDKIED